MRAPGLPQDGRGRGILLRRRACLGAGLELKLQLEGTVTLGDRRTRAGRTYPPKLRSRLGCPVCYGLSRACAA